MENHRAFTLNNARNQKAPRKAVKRNAVGRPRADVVALDAEATILRRALHLFSELGFAAVSTKEIGAAAGLNTALIYYYFGSKEELFRRCVVLAATEAAALFEQAAGSDLSAEAQVHAWLNCQHSCFRTVERLLRISMSYSASAVKEPDADAAMQTFHNTSRTVLEGALRRGVENREFAQLDVEQTVTFMTRYLDGVYVRAILFSDYDPTDDIAELRDFLKVRLHSIEG